MDWVDGIGLCHGKPFSSGFPLGSKKILATGERSCYDVSFHSAAFIQFVRGTPSLAETRFGHFYVDVNFEYNKVSTLAAISAHDYGSCADFPCFARAHQRKRKKPTGCIWESPILLLCYPYILDPRPRYARARIRGQGLERVHPVGPGNHVWKTEQLRLWAWNGVCRLAGSDPWIVSALQMVPTGQEQSSYKMVAEVSVML